MRRFLLPVTLNSLVLALTTAVTAIVAPTPDRQETCDILVIGGGLAGAATAYEALVEGRTVCMTEITDWVGGQISSQGTSALDERPTQRELLFFPKGYLEFRDRIKEHYGRLNPGGCWVSATCFMPYDGHEILFEMLQDAEKQGGGTLKWFPATVVKDVEIANRQIISATAIQHQPAPGTPPLNTEPLSQVIEEAYRYEDSPRFDKTIIQFVPATERAQGSQAPEWYVIEATETGEILALTDVPYQLGVDPRSSDNPTSSSINGAAYCTQGFTYTFAMEATAAPQEHQLPDFYQTYQPYYSYELERLASFPLVFTYRQIYTTRPDEPRPGNVRDWPIYPGDISMQNWTWGNDYRPGTLEDNLIFTRDQLQTMGQLEPGNWLGGLRADTLRRGEENAIGYFYWLVEGTTDSQLGDNVKKPHPNHRYLAGLDSPMGTVHGLSKFPYMREARRVIGRPSFGYPEGFTIGEVDMSRNDFSKEFYPKNLPPDEYEAVRLKVAGLELPALVTGLQTVKQTSLQGRAELYPDSVGIGHYAIDFHPCMVKSPAETPGNIERPGERLGQGAAYPFQIPLRAMIPQEIDNMLVVGKSIATSHIASAAYRVHSFEWSSGVAAGATAIFALEEGIAPYELVDDLPRQEPQLERLQQRLVKSDNPIAFPGTSIFNRSWQNWQ
ncbi:MAG: FAD-dependent oxidoreductase [Oscillatoriales cyanobacterium RM2_1_1]|nr:FAD-dependent oxidoreductase [Oscillatoriales cyanobacterium SM2_3_0]NJO46585.1 FAD-dependent oxidoreductase [Oscillatoriales cyanobacterium RM2_1_1]